MDRSLDEHNFPKDSRLIVYGFGDATEDEINSHFAGFGDIEFINVTRETGRSNGRAYVKFTKPSDAAKALEKLNGLLLGSKQQPISVKIATPETK